MQDLVAHYEWISFFEYLFKTYFKIKFRTECHLRQ